MTTDSDEHGQFKRILGPVSAGALIAGSMIGTGIFLFVSEVAQRFHDAPTILFLWTLGAVIAATGALCLAELAAAYPKTGGIYVFLDRAYGPAVSFLYVWAKFLIMRVGSFAIPALFFADLLGTLIGAPTSADGWSGRVPTALGVIVVLTAINVAGVRAGGGVQNLFTAVKILILLAVVGIGMMFAAGLLEAMPLEPIATKAPDSGPWILLVGTAMIPVLWTFGGWDESPFVAEEVREPHRNLPRSIVIGVTGVALLFLLVNGAYLSILSPAEIAASDGRTILWAMQRAVGPGAGVLVCLALMISTFGAANGMALTGGRIAFAAGRDHGLFRWFARTHSRTRTPARALVIQCVLCCIAAVVMPDPMTLLYYTGLAYWLFSGLPAAAVIILRRCDPLQPRPFKVWAYPVTPALFILASVGMCASIIVQYPPRALATAGILLAGLVVYFAQRGWANVVR